MQTFLWPFFFKNLAAQNQVRWKKVPENIGKMCILDFRVKYFFNREIKWSTLNDTTYINVLVSP